MKGAQVNNSLVINDSGKIIDVGEQLVINDINSDMDTVAASLSRTAKLAIVHESVEFIGWGSEVAAWVSEHRFEDLDGPIVRMGAERTPIPFQPHLEDEVIPTTDRVADAIRALARH